MHRTDANHAAVGRWYRALHCSTVDLSPVGRGCGDWLIGCCGITALVEVKTESGDLESSQIEFWREWRGNPMVIVRRFEDVCDHVATIRAVSSRRTR
jgi:hypothetical protein